MLRNNSCMFLGGVYADLYSSYCSRTVISLLAQCFEILRRSCWSSSNLNNFIIWRRVFYWELNHS